MFEYLKDSVRIAKKGKLSKATLMRDEQIHLIQKKPYLFMAAAVSDYIPSYAQIGKLKKESLGDEWDLKLKQNVDILNSIDKSDITTVGFKAEMDEEHAVINALKMIDSKGVDAVCLNILKDSSSFGTDTNKIDFIHKDKKESIPLGDKLTVALEILEHAKNL
jgi:phosphopantothenoylcysteine decarboxylase/phosphopantothenate--cysteine ligase